MARDQSRIAVRHLEALWSEGAIGGLKDAELLRLFATQRDEAGEMAFAALVDRHGPMVMRVCRALLRDPHDAEDAFQATFLVLVLRSRGLGVRETLGPWLHQVAHRTASCARSARIRRMRHERLAASYSPYRVPAESFDDLGEVLHEEVGRLPERYRAAVVLCLLEGLTPEQAGRQLGWPAGTVRSRLARGRERLRSRLTRRGLAPAHAGSVAPVSAGTAEGLAAPALATVRAATRLAAGEAMAGIVSANVRLLTIAGMRMKMLTKLTMAAGMTLALGIAATAAGTLLVSRGSDPPQGTGGPGPIQVRPPQPVEKVTKEALVLKGQAFSLALSPDGKTLAAGCTDRSIHLLDAGTGDIKATLTGVARGYVRRVVFTPDGRTVLAVGDDNQLRIWDATSGKLTRSLPALVDLEPVGLPAQSPNSLGISPDGSLVAIGGADTTDRAGGSIGDDKTFFVVQVMDPNTAQLVWSHVGRRGYLDQLVFSPDGKTLAGATHGEIRLWEAGSGDLKQTLKPRSGTVWAVAFSPDNRLLAGYGDARVEGQRGCVLTIWDRGSCAILHSIDAGPAASATSPGALAFSPDGKSLASAGTGIKTGRISIRGGPIAVGQKVTNHVKLWDVGTGALKWTSAEGDLGLVKSLLFSADGESIFCCDDTAASRIDALTGQTRRDLMMATEGQVISPFCRKTRSLSHDLRDYASSLSQGFRSRR